MGFFTKLAKQSMPSTRLLNPNAAPGPRNPYIPTRMSPPTGGPRLGQIPPSSGPGPFNPSPGNMPIRGAGLGIGSIVEQILARKRAADRIASRQMQPLPTRKQEGGEIRDTMFRDGNGNGIDDRDEVSTMPMPPAATQESLFGPSASAVMQESMREYGGMRSPYEGFAEYFSRPVYDRSTPQAPPQSIPTPGPAPVLGADDPRANLNDRIAQLMDPGKQGLTKEEALYNQLQSIGKGYDINNDGVVTNAEFQMSMNPDFTGVDSRVQELMDSGMTRLEALAKQSYGIQQGYDLNNDGMVTNAEFAEFMRNQPAATAPAVAQEAAPEIIVPTEPEKEFLNTLGTVQGATQAADASPAAPDSVQNAIDQLREQGIPGIFGGNLDLTALQKQIADYLESIGYQAPDQQQTAMSMNDQELLGRVPSRIMMR